jgi:type I restriction enzyme M protein
MLPLTVLRRLDCVLEPTKDTVISRTEALADGKVKNLDPILMRETGVPFYNTSRYTFERLRGDPNNIASNLTNYIQGFSKRARDIIEKFGFEEHIAKLEQNDRLFLIVSKFCEIDLGHVSSSGVNSIPQSSLKAGHCAAAVAVVAARCDVSSGSGSSAR